MPKEVRQRRAISSAVATVAVAVVLALVFWRDWKRSEAVRTYTTPIQKDYGSQSEVGEAVELLQERDLECRSPAVPWLERDKGGHTLWLDTL